MPKAALRCIGIRQVGTTQEALLSPLVMVSDNANDWPRRSRNTTGSQQGKTRPRQPWKCLSFLKPIPDAPSTQTDAHAHTPIRVCTADSTSSHRMSDCSLLQLEFPLRPVLFLFSSPSFEHYIYNAKQKQKHTGCHLHERGRRPDQHQPVQEHPAPVRGAPAADAGRARGRIRGERRRKGGELSGFDSRRFESSRKNYVCVFCARGISLL